MRCKDMKFNTEIKGFIPERWKRIADFPGYEVSTLGRVRNLINGNISVGTIANTGYRMVTVSYLGKQRIRPAHRLVAETFIDNSQSLPVVHHINGNKLDNRRANLMWANYDYNYHEPIAKFRHDQAAKKRKKAVIAISSDGKTANGFVFEFAN